MCVTSEKLFSCVFVFEAHLWVCGQMQKCHITTRREKKELQKILDRKRLNSIIEAKKAEKDKAEA